MQEDGSTLREHLQVVQKKSKTPLPELVQPELPSSCYEVWSWFIKLHKKRQSGMAVNPVSWEAMQAFFFLNDIVPETWEIDMIDKFDDIVLDQYAKMQKKEAKKNNKKK